MVYYLLLCITHVYKFNTEIKCRGFKISKSRTYMCMISDFLVKSCTKFNILTCVIKSKVLLKWLMKFFFLFFFKILDALMGLPWSWSYDSWIYNYHSNQCLSSLTLWVRISLRQGVLDTTLCDKVCQWLSHLRQVDSFLRVLRYPPSIKLTIMIY